MKIRKIKVAGAMGSLTASVALLAGINGAYAQGAPGAGSFPGSFLVPGTTTSFAVGGYVKWDYTYDFGQFQNINGGNSPFGVCFDGGVFSVKGVPGSPGGFPVNVAADSCHRIHGASQMTASESRFNIQTRTPTAYGELKTFIEGDFTNPNGLTNSGSLHVNSNSYGFRLRQAYGTLGPFLAGQTLSLFRDGDSEAETLDFGGAQALGVTRQPQVRYTFDFGNGLTAAISAENPQTQIFDVEDGFGATHTTFGVSPKQGEKIPDFVLAGKYNAPWGHLKLAAVFRDLNWHTGVPNTDNDLAAASNEFGWGVAFSGNYNIPLALPTTKDGFAWEVGYGQGAGRYINSDGPPTPDANLISECPDSTCATVRPRTLHAIPSWLVSLNYTHYWTDNLRTNLAGSYWQQDNKKQDFVFSSESFNAAFKRTYTAHVNLIWSPVPQTNFGVEYQWMEGEQEIGRKGRINRIQASAQFKF